MTYHAVSIPCEREKGRQIYFWVSTHKLWTVCLMYHRAQYKTNTYIFQGQELWTAKAKRRKLIFGSINCLKLIHTFLFSVMFLSGQSLEIWNCLPISVNLKSHTPKNICYKGHSKFTQEETDRTVETESQTKDYQKTILINLIYQNKLLAYP
jgi:hypothetical protein